MSKRLTGVFLMYYLFLKRGFKIIDTYNGNNEYIIVMQNGTAYRTIILRPKETK